MNAGEPKNTGEPKIRMRNLGGKNYHEDREYIEARDNTEARKKGEIQKIVDMLKNDETCQRENGQLEGVGKRELGKADGSIKGLEGKLGRKGNTGNGEWRCTK